MKRSNDQPPMIFLLTRDDDDDSYLCLPLTGKKSKLGVGLGVGDQKEAWGQLIHQLSVYNKRLALLPQSDYWKQAEAQGFQIARMKKRGRRWLKLRVFRPVIGRAGRRSTSDTRSPNAGSQHFVGDFTSLTTCVQSISGMTRSCMSERSPVTSNC